MADFSPEFSTIGAPRNVNALISSLKNSHSDISKVLNFMKCSSTLDISELISETTLISTIFDNFPSIIALRFRINGELNICQAYQPKKHEFDRKERFLISYEGSNHMIIFWKNEKALDFFRLRIINEQMSTEIKSFILDFILVALKEEKSVKLISNNDADVTGLLNYKNHNLLFDAVFKRNVDIVRELVKLPFDVNECQNSQELRIIDHAWTNGDLSIVFELLKANSSYPKNFNESNASESINKFLKISEDMHKAIEENKLAKVEEILAQNSNLRYFFNTQNVSALTVALKNGNTQIYCILAHRNVTFGPNEDISSNHSYEFLDSICDLNSDVSKSLPKRHIWELLSRSVIPHGDPHYSQRLEDVKEAFMQIDDIPEVMLAFQVISISKLTKIHFDFTQDSVWYMDPTVGPTTRGLFNPANHHIHISAKGLLKDETKKDVWGVMAHEPTHSALNLVFMNERLPYAIDDEINEKRFAEILEECKNLMDKEILISTVFRCYKEAAHKRELIVRVPQMLAYYKDDQLKLNQQKRIFKNLFDYYEDVVMPAMYLALRVLNKLSDDSKEIEFNDLTGPLKAAILHSWVQFQGQDVQLKDIAGDKKSKVFNHLTSQQIREIIGRKTLTIGKSLATEIEHYIPRSWIHSKFEGDIWCDNELTSQAQAAICNFDSLITEVNFSKIFLLSDHSNAGKSTTLRDLSVRFKEKHKDHFVLFISLQKNIKIFKKNEIKLNQKHPQQLTEEIINILLQISSPADNLESEIFKHLFNEGKMEIFLDGADEILPKYKEFLFNFIEVVQKYSNNRIWITTRPFYAKEIKFAPKSYTLLPFNNNESKNYLRYAIKSRTTLEEQKLNGEMTKIFKIFENIDFIDSPRMLNLIADLYVAGKLTSSFNQFSLYEALIEQNKEIQADKGQVVNLNRDIDSEVSLLKVHQLYALKHVMSSEKFKDVLEGDFIKINDLRLLKMWRSEKRNWSAEPIDRCGFLTVENWNSNHELPEFVHKNFIDYFMAKFIIESVKNAIEFDKSSLDNDEFMMRMKFAFYVITEWCQGSLNGACKFISNYLSVVEEDLNFSERFLRFLDRDDVQKFIVRMIDRNTNEFAEKFSLMIINSRSLSQIFFEICQKQLSESKIEIAKIFSIFAVHAIQKITNQTKLLESFLLFFDKIEISLSFHSEFMQVALTDEKGIILYYSLINNMNQMKRLYKKYLSPEDICKLLLKSAYINLDQVVNVSSIKIFDTFCNEVSSKIRSVFQIIFIYSDDFNKILDFIGLMRKNLPGDWVKFTGYKPKKTEIFDETVSTSEASAKDLNNLLDFIISHQIPSSHLRIFLMNNLVQMLKLIYFDEIILIEKVIEILKILQNDKQPLDVGNLFVETAEHILGLESNVISSHPYLYAINIDCKVVIKLISCQSIEKIMKFLFQNINQVNKLNLIKPRNFKNFFENFPSVSDQYSDQYKIDFISKKNNDQSESFLRFNNESEIVFYILNFIAHNSCQKSDLENFFKNRFCRILRYAFQYRSIIDVTFVILRKYFSQNKTIVVEWIRNDIDLTSFFNQKIITPECVSVIEYYWENVQKFFASDDKLIQNVLLGNYVYHHPLVLGIYYNICNLSKFYFKYCSGQEILDSFTKNAGFLIDFYYNLENCRNFFTFFVNNSDRQILFVKFMNSDENFNLFGKNFSNVKLNNSFDLQKIKNAAKLNTMLVDIFENCKAQIIKKNKSLIQ